MSIHRKLLLAFVLTTGLCGAVASAQGVDIERDELRAALTAALAKSRAQDAELARLQTVNRNLGESLRVANTEAAEFKLSYQKMRLQMEALGIEAVTDGARGVEGKLIKAVSDLRLLEEEKRNVSEALIALSDAALHLADTAVNPNPDARAAVEKAIAEADVALGLSPAQDPAGVAGGGDIHSGRVVSLKKDYGVVVLNLGKRAGVRIGMPFEIRRKDRPIGTVIVVDVRDNVAATLIENLNDPGDPPRVGDGASVATTE